MQNSLMCSQFLQALFTGMRDVADATTTIEMQDFAVAASKQPSAFSCSRVHMECVKITCLFMITTWCTKQQ